jgi:glucose-6-phosphate isomerase
MDNSHINYFLGANEGTVLQALAALKKDRIVERIWAKDYTVWKQTPDSIVNRLGWLDAPAETLKKLPYVHSVLDPIIKEGYKNAVLLGVGGSSLGAEVFNKILGNRQGYPRLYILDTTDPVTISRITNKLQLEKTIFLVSSKTGTTLETVSLFHYFYNLALEKLGRETNEHFIFITDPDSPLEALARRLSLKHAFLNNPAIGGRYSALSFPGIVPAALIGIDVERLLQKADAATKKETVAFFNGELNDSGIVLGVVLGTLARIGRNKVTFIFPPQWESLGSWLEQLIAESTGKEGKGILPVLERELREPDSYGTDRLFVIFHNTTNNISSKLSHLTTAGHPVITLKVDDDYDVGAQMFCWEMATAVASHILGVNPFNQPNVDATKNLTGRMLDLYREKKGLPREEPSFCSDWCIAYQCPGSSTPAGAFAGFLAGATANAYVCLQSYLSPTKEIEELLNQLCSAISSKYKLAVTISYGPRYLHSTGQLHKGDTGHGLFIQLTADDREDVKIPNRLSSAESALSFGLVKVAQAMGDRQALLDLGRKVIRFHLQENIVAGLKTLTKAIN